MMHPVPYACTYLNLPSSISASLISFREGIVVTDVLVCSRIDEYVSPKGTPGLTSKPVALQDGTEQADPRVELLKVFLTRQFKKRRDNSIPLFCLSHFPDQSSIN